MTQTNEQLLTFFNYAIEQVSVGIHAIDQKGHTILYNKKMKEIEGYNIEDVSDRSIIDIFTIQNSDSTLLRVLQTGTKEINVKQTYWNKEGHEITTINDTFPVYENGQIIGAIEFAKDITSFEKLFYRPLRRYGEPLTFNVITAVSVQIQKVIETAKKAAKARIPVLLIGESGTGKDMIAESIHYELNPQNDLFVTLSGRKSDVLKRFSTLLTTNDSYTFFFERIELLPIPMQKQLIGLLNNLSTPQHMFIGSISKDPIDLISEGILLKELYYYFASISIIIPSLKERKEDIEPFVKDYFNRHRERFASNIEGLSKEVMTMFLQYDWPGNLKELELLLDEITSMITNESVITYEMLPLHFRFKVQQVTNTNREPDFYILHSNKKLLPLDEYLKEAENYYVHKVLNMYDGNITKAANALGMSRQNLQYRIRKLKKRAHE